MDLGEHFGPLRSGRRRVGTEEARRAGAAGACGFGAIGEEGVLVLNPRVIRLAAITADELADVEESERAVLP